jgi:Ca-activated chloride channel family protein
MTGDVIGLGFIAPLRLLLLVLPVALAVGYALLAARRRRYALRFTSLELLDEVAPDRPGWRRHVPALVLLAGIVVAALAFARPTIAADSTRTQRVVVLAVDTSLSMEATDVSPSRITAAKDAATRFLDTVPDGVAVGVVGFDGQARQLIAPTERLDAVRRVIEGADLGEGTAIGEAVFVSLEAIAASADDAERTGDELALGAIVLLSDGETTQGRSNDDAARAAEAQGVEVNTIAFGTDAGSIEDPATGSQVSVPVNRDALARLAETTGGDVLSAETADELRTVYEELGEQVTVDEPRQEVTDWFAGIALLLVAFAGAGSLMWAGRLP